MATDSDVIREFLVKLGFKLDSDSLEKFTGAVVTSTKRVIALASALEATAAGVAAVTKRIADHMEDLYYASERTKTSAANILAFKYAFGQLGGTAQQAGNVLDNIASFIRNTPAAEQWFRGFGVQIRNADGSLKQMNVIANDTNEAFKGMDFWAKKARAGVLGIDEATLLVMQRGNLEALGNKNKSWMAAFGLDPAKIAEQSKDFNNRVRDMVQIVEWMVMKIGGQLIDRFRPQLEKFFVWIQKNGPHLVDQIVHGLGQLLTIVEKMSGTFMWILDLFVKLDAATGGWSTKILGLLAALKFLGALSIIELLWKMGAGFLSVAAGSGAAAAGATSYAGAATAAQAATLGLSGALAALIGLPIAAWAGWTIGTKINEGLTKLQDKYAKDHPNADLDVNRPNRGSGVITPKAPDSPSAGRGSKKKDPDQSARIHEALDYFQAMGWSAAQATGLVANLVHESGLNQKSVGDSGKAFGIAQWHADRQEDFRKFIGHDIKTSTFEEQLQFIQQELTRGKERHAGDMLRQAAGARDAAHAVSKFYERPRDTDKEAAARGDTAVQLSQKTEIHVSGGNSPVETAKAVSREQAQVNNTLARNLRGAVVA